MFADKRALWFNIDTEQNTPQLPEMYEVLTIREGQSLIGAVKEDLSEPDFELKLRELS